MKELIKVLECSLESKGRTIDITGKELMDIMKIKKEEMTEEINSKGLDYIYISTSLNSKEKIDFSDYVLLEESNLFRIKDLDCTMIRCKLYKNKGLCEYIKILKEICIDVKIDLFIKCLDKAYIKLEIKNKNIINVIFNEFNFNDLDFDDIKELLYQLIILSFNVSLKETFSCLKLI